MLDIHGAKIHQEAILYSIKFGKVGPKMKCFGFRNTDNTVILGQDRRGEQPIFLTQDQLLTTHIWVVDPTHIQRQDHPLVKAILKLKTKQNDTNQS
jgi:hypothetical protein